MIYIKVYSYKYLKYHFFYNSEYQVFSNSSSYKSKMEDEHCDRIYLIKDYGEQERLGIPDWAIELKANKKDNPEYFLSIILCINILTFITIGIPII